MISLLVYIIKRVRAPPPGSRAFVPYRMYVASATGRWLVVRCWSFFTRFFAPPTSVFVSRRVVSLINSLTTSGVKAIVFARGKRGEEPVIQKDTVTVL